MKHNFIRVLITRTLTEKQTHIQYTSPLQIVSIPFIETVYHISQKEEILPLLEKSITAIITSQNAVESLIRNFGIEKLSQATWNIYSIGFATKRKIETYFSNSIIIDTAENIEILSDIMIQSDVEQFYFLGSNIRQQFWIDKLQQQNQHVEEYWVYQTQLKSQKIDYTLYQTIVFFSPSAVDSFFLKNTIPLHMPLFAIGTTTQKAILKYGNYHVILSLKPEYESLLTTIKQYFFNTIH